MFCILQVDGYLHNEEEKHYKKIIWEQLNREYLEVICSLSITCSISFLGKNDINLSQKYVEKCSLAS